MKFLQKRVLLFVLIVLLCAGISPMVTAEGKSGVWKFTEVNISVMDPSPGNVDPIILKPGSFTYTQTSRPDDHNIRYSKTVTASWNAPPETLTPGGKVHISGEITYEGPDGTKVINSGEILSAYFEKADMLEHGYATAGYGETVKTSAAYQSPHGVLDADLAVPNAGSDTGNPQKINLRFIVMGGAVNYIYTYTTPPLGSVRPDYNSGLPCRCEQYVATNVETNNCLYYGKTEECTKCFWECDGGNPPKESVGDVTGTWSTEWGDIQLKQDGNRVTGSYPHDNGIITASLNGNTLSGSWAEGPTYSGNNDSGGFVFIFTDDFTSFEGTWGYGSSSNSEGEWNGVKIS